LEFQHAYAKKYDEITDSLIVYVSGDCGESWTRVFAAGEDGTGNFATHEKTNSFWPENYSDWCGIGYGASCINIDLTPWAGIADVRIAFESWCGYGNPMFIDNVEISQFVGQDELTDTQNDVNIYPNPTEGIFKISLGKNNLFNHLDIYNQVGQLVKQIKIEDNSNSIDIKTADNWEPGIYFIKLTGRTENISKKIVIF